MVDLSGLGEHLAALAGRTALPIPFGERVYEVPYPTEDDWERCLAIWSARDITDPAERTKVERAALRGQTLAELALSPAIVAQMNADGVPAPVMRRSTSLALTLWIAGEAAAQRYVDRLMEQASDAPGKASTPTPAPRSRKRSGTGTASASKTRTPASGPAATESPST